MPEPDPLPTPNPIMPMRTEAGYFAAGNTFARGRPKAHAGKVVALRSQLFTEVTPEKWAKIIRSMIAEAVGIFDPIERKWVARPNVKAAEWIGDRLIGKPVEAGAEDRLKRLEELLGLDDALDPEAVADHLEAARPEGPT